MNTCINCKHYHSEIEDRSSGFCRRNPPTVFTSSVYNKQGREIDVQLNSYWPPIAGDKYCGEFKGIENV